MDSALRKKIEKRLKFIYGGKINPDYVEHFIAVLNNHIANEKTPAERWNENDAILITYGDSVQSSYQRPLQTLKKFADQHLMDVFSYIQILPFFPYTSDDGFSVVDYTKVNPDLGNWEDIKQLQEYFGIMADLVINHISQKSEWFQQFLKDEKPGRDYFITASPDDDLSQVVRPRNLPLLTPFVTKSDKKYVWTTFSDDQIDLNYGNPAVLLEMIKVLLFYAEQGARVIRLDAIAFLWKKIGTNCLHLPETHEVVKLMRDALEYCYPSAIIITETNVPHLENISYFGDGDEAHMVYNFTLPPLLLHCLHTGNATHFKQWVTSLGQPPKGCTYFNFTASHDGIGVRPLEGILSKDDIAQLADGMKSFGGHISTKSNSDGTESPYEMNITYFDALKGTNKGSDDYQVQRFICAQIIAMELMGIPALYIHSLTATQNYHEGVAVTGHKRTINRKKWNEKELVDKLKYDEQVSTVFSELIKCLSIRKNYRAFHPDAKQEVIPSNDSLVVIKRTYPDEQPMLCISNVTDQNCYINSNEWGIADHSDVLSGCILREKSMLKPYQTVWVETNG